MYRKSVRDGGRFSSISNILLFHLHNRFVKLIKDTAGESRSSSNTVMNRFGSVMVFCAFVMVEFS